MDLIDIVFTIASIRRVVSVVKTMKTTSFKAIFKLALLLAVIAGFIWLLLNAFAGHGIQII